ncbi:hypothetical protein AAY473_012877 [Plecturocebus cupreus]
MPYLLVWKFSTFLGRESRWVSGCRSSRYLRSFLLSTF